MNGDKLFYLKELKSYIQEGDYLSKADSGIFRKVIGKYDSQIKLKCGDHGNITYSWNITDVQFHWVVKRAMECSLKIPDVWTLIYDSAVLPIKEVNVKSTLLDHFSTSPQVKYRTGNLSAIEYFKEMVSDGLVPYERAQLEIVSSPTIVVRWKAKNTISFNKDIAYNNGKGVLAKDNLLNLILNHGTVWMA
ncbi:hypothetical protein H6G33_10205 [Calothrix sp. FACHB-1219]|uniref:hypothetical protein n=1 Tax=unclassified Calothrix TaxID=2619626 RepID=UPI001684CE56|nr:MULTISPECIES: hypothetical protein [unclassified Calothrix]MBD2201719.1 hypothetical protein [Calothrix sp. FACHB-168]MBD2217405.1 hypothetical protein [Calothrix sp. FACHB-1219]